MGFIGATDSAAPCAMIMHAARSVDEALSRKWDAMQAEGMSGLEEEKGVQILFLDGEEAFLSWTDSDSLYGARYVSSILDSWGVWMRTNGTDRWLSSGILHLMRRCLRTIQHSVQSHYSSSSIY